jgi:manganese/iron transport system ATP-binding protein
MSILFPSLRKTQTVHEAGSAIVEAHNLTVHYAESVALQDVTFRIEAGMRVAVVGPNGAGKSTLFKAIAGILAPSSGSVNVFGHEPDSHICIAYLPQRSQVDWRFPASVRDVVMMGRTRQIGFFRNPGARDHQKVNDALGLVDMLHFAERQISELSGGQQQRMFIARALAQEAELVLMDEPLNNLDAPSQAAILQILDELRQRNVTVMIALHDLKLAAEHFPQALLLNRHLYGFGAPADLFAPDLLARAYRGHLHVSAADGQLLAFDDTCCDGDSHAD